MTSVGDITTALTTALKDARKPTNPRYTDYEVVDTVSRPDLFTCDVGSSLWLSLRLTLIFILEDFDLMKPMLCDGWKHGTRLKLQSVQDYPTPQSSTFEAINITNKDFRRKYSV